MTSKELLEKFGIPVTYLNPVSLSPNRYKSKMGGQQTYTLEENNKCEYCDQPMCLILEVYKSDFEDFYFPADTDYAQIKTCYEEECDGEESHDIKFYISYGKIENLKLNTENIETHIPSVYLSPERSFEIPYQTYESAEQLEIIEQMGVEAYEVAIYENVARIGTKLNGDVFSWHGIDIPICDCGDKKAHILQISSYEPCIHPDEKRPYYEWDSSMGVFVGDCGNYHFFVCKKCGDKTMEHVWDCR